MFGSWLKANSVSSDIDLILFCFHFAGGGPSLFREWKSRLPSNVEVCPVQLPGRETRIMDEPYDCMSDLVDDLCEDIFSKLKHPYALFGHSMGALIASQIAYRVQERELKGLKHLYVSGRRALHIPDPKSPMHDLSDEQFVDRLKAIGGTPDAVLESPELMEMLMPILRADFKLIETWQYSDVGPLSCPITALGGDKDEMVPWEMVEAWKDYTTESFTTKRYDGGHFFIQTNQSQLLRDLSDSIERLIKRS